jgi:amino acid adenylation domain-containing protein
MKLIMRDLNERIAALSPEQRELFEAKLKKRGLSLQPSQTIPRRQRQNECRLSFDQERIWVVDQMEPGNPAYNIFSMSRLKGAIDVPLMERALNEIVRRHEVLRTTFTAIDGEPRQVIAPSLFVPLELIDLRALTPEAREREVTRVLNEETSRPFDLALGPLVRFGLVRVEDDEYVLHYTMHHTVTDRWSGDIIEAEMVAIYMAFAEGQPSPLPELPIQFADFAEWQRDWLQGEVLETQIAYWRKQLDGVPHVLELPTDHPRPPVQTFHGARHMTTLPKHVLDGLKAFTRQEQATMFMTCLAAYKTLLYRYTNQEDILVGVAVANRNRPEMLGLIGYFLNMLVIRTNFNGNPTFREVLRREKEAAMGAFAHGEFPFGRLMQELKPKIDPSRNPLFQAAYIYLDFAPTTDAQMAGITATPMQWDNGASRFDMTLALTELEDGLEVVIEFNTDLFERPTIERMFLHFRSMLDAIIANPDRPVAHLPLLTASERERLLVEWNETDTSYPEHSSIQQLFEAQVERTPDSIALVFDDEQLTYAELNRRANQLAHHLRALGVEREVLVGLLLERSALMVVGLLAILKAGGAYVPLDPSYPLERLDFMLKDAQLAVLLTVEELLDTLPSFSGQIICLDTDASHIGGASFENPTPQATGENLAYVIYTSGSTGQPKGISILHRAVTRLVLETNYIQIQPSDRVAQASNASFDAATFELWGALLNGAQLTGMSREMLLTPASFAAQIQELEISVMFLTTALFNQLAALAPQAFSTVRCLLFGGEAVEPKWVRKVLKEGAPARLLHVYGPTESTTFTTWHEVGEVEEDAATIPIGRPLSNTQVYLLDQNLEPVPAGVPGEIYIGGDGLARDYLRRPAVTAEKFLPDALGRKAGARLYRTGDLARYLPDGSIEFLGRADNQVKVRGFRIELEEIEAALGAHPSIEEAVVLASKDGLEERRLVAYLVCDEEGAPTASELRNFLAAKLPDYMIPSVFIMLEQLPLTPNGKVDRRALPAQDQTRLEVAQDFIAPSSPTEIILAAIWAEVLGVERVGVHDSFFELGGDSLLAIQVVSKAREHELMISIHQLFLHPTIAALARERRQPEAGLFESERTSPFSLIREADRALLPSGVEDAYPLTRLQAGMIFHSEYEPDTAVYHDIFSLHIRAMLDLEALRATFEELMRRHAVLRTSFELSNYSEPLQLVHEQVSLPLQFEDLTYLSESQQRGTVAAYIAAERKRGFDWRRAPLLRLLVQRRSDETFQFNLSFHHAILDGWSLSSLLNELFQHYIALVERKTGALGAPPVIDFREFVALERAAMQSETHRRFWLDKLDDAPQTRVPRRSSNAKATTSGTPLMLPFAVEIPLEVSKGLKRFSNEAGVPLKSVLLAAHLRVLSFLNGQRDVLTGVVSNGRPEEADGERMIGLFLNTLPFRLRLRAGTWTELARATFEAEREMLPFRRYPLLEMQQMMGGRKLFEVGFNYTHFHIVQGMLQLKEMEILEIEAVSETNFSMLADFNLEPATSQVQLALEYDAGEFSHEQIESIGGYYRRTLAAMALHPQERYETAALLSGAELQQQFETWTSTMRDYPRERCLHQLFEEQVERTPGALALEFEDEQLSYAELNRRANQLAHFLRGKGIGPETLVGLLLERSTLMVVGLLAILKAGGAYVAFDPQSPPERIAYMMEDARVLLLLTQRTLADLLAPASVESSCLDDVMQELSEEREDNPVSQVSPDNLIYIVYTSGSTGQPKGIAMIHRPLLNIINYQIQRSGLEARPRTLQFASLSFDVSIQEMFSTWLVGATLLLIDEEARRDARQLWRLVKEQGIERLFLPFVALQQLAQVAMAEPQDVPASLREIITAGEQLKTTSNIRFLCNQLEGYRLDNQYGPSEAHVVTTFMLEGETALWPDLPPIGKPVFNTQIYLLDDSLQPLPVGTPGEVYVGGDGLARGYLHRPVQTAERFIPHPYSQQPGARLYKTGDLARYLPGGNLEFLGRNDEQVKVRGYRIELGEVEAALASHPAVSESVVVVHNAGAGEKRLVAYVMSAEGEALSIGELRQFVGRKLPDYMVPSIFIMIERVPRTINGKVEYRALPAPGTMRPLIESVFVAPGTPTEESLAHIWSTVLGVERVGAHDDFFELGGNSLSATQLVLRIRQAFDVELPLRALFKHSSVAQLASLLEEILLKQVNEMTDEEAAQLLKEGF